jgi:hypothetical protein
MGPNVLPAGRLALIQESIYSNADFVTTNVGTPQQVYSVPIYIPTSHIALYVYFSGSAWHTTADAEINWSIKIGIDNTPTAEYTLVSVSQALINANRHKPIHLSAAWDIDQMPNIIRPGDRRVSLYVTNGLAGTLTLPFAGFLEPLHCMVVGEEHT